MRLYGLFAAALVFTAELTPIAPALSQSTNYLETQTDAERRRQAEQYNYQKEQERRGNILNTEKPRPLGDNPPVGFSNPSRNSTCLSHQPNCR